MRIDTAAVLVAMGFDSVLDFTAKEDPPGNVTVVWKSQTVMPSAAAIAAFDMSASAVAMRTTTTLRTDANSVFQTDTTAPAKVLRGACMVLLDEINSERQWIMTFKAAVAVATTLADLKTRVAALADMPDRTAAQARTAVQNKINGGTVD